MSLTENQTSDSSGAARQTDGGLAMSGGPHSFQPAAPFVPPTQPGGIRAPQGASSWPRIIGIIAIVLGALGILGGLQGMLAPWILEAVASIMPRGTEGTLDAVVESANWLIVTSIMTTGVAALLLAGGVGLVKRRQWGIGTCRAWAVLKMLLVLLNTGVGYFVQEASLTALAEQTPRGAQMSEEFVTAAVVLGLILGVAWGWAFPVFMLIWLGRGRVKAETSAWS